MTSVRCEVKYYCEHVSVKWFHFNIYLIRYGCLAQYRVGGVVTTALRYS